MTCGTCEEGEHPYGASLHTCGARSAELLLQGYMYWTLSRRWPDSPSRKAVVVLLLHTLTILGHTFPSRHRVSELEKILESILCPCHTDGKTELSTFKSLAQNKPVEPGTELPMAHQMRDPSSQCREPVRRPPLPRVPPANEEPPSDQEASSPASPHS